jgi:uroporphyrin-III C-methyltransferase
VDLSGRRRWALSILGEKGRTLAQQRGFVYLVGAGPGDPKLLTVRALELLQRADVVAFDMLVPEPILALLPPHVEKLNVGRRHGMQKQSYRLHPEVVARAREGKMVVRLKAGDPFVFGRGGEEAEELVEAGIPFEVVPGISAALGAAANTGIPLTHRQYASHVKFVTCHDADDARRPRKELGTTVLYMVAHRLRASMNRLIEEGYPPDTPAAYVEAATTPSQRVITGTLADLHEKVEPGRSSAPGLVIAGEVVNLRAIIGRPAC